MSIPENETFEAALERFVVTVQAFLQDHAAASDTVVLSVIRGATYTMIVRQGYWGRAAFCFINNSNGDVLRSGSWKGPAEGATKSRNKGNIYEELSGYNITPYGAAYG